MEVNSHGKHQNKTDSKNETFDGGLKPPPLELEANHFVGTHHRLHACLPAGSQGPTPRFDGVENGRILLRVVLLGLALIFEEIEVDHLADFEFSGRQADGLFDMQRQAREGKAKQTFSVCPASGRCIVSMESVMFFPM